MSCPLVTVLIPVYNHENYVTESILSVLKQTYSNIELIVVNDGSTDKSHTVISGLLEQYRFKYYNQQNVGLIATIEKYRLLAQGKYISILASDDLLCDSKVEVLVAELEKSGNAMAYANSTMINSKNEIIGTHRVNGRSGQIFNELLLGQIFINALTTLVRTSVYNQCEFTSDYIEDFPVWLQIAEKNGISYVDRCVASYRFHDANISGNFEKMQLEEERIISRYRGLDIYPEVIDAWNLRWFKLFAKNNKKIAIKKYLFRVFKLKNFLKLDLYLAFMYLLSLHTIIELRSKYAAIKS